MSRKVARDEWIGWYEKMENAKKSKNPKLHQQIIDDLLGLINFQVFKHDKSGEILLDKDGRPQIDWMSIMTGIGRLIGRIIALAYSYKK